MRIFLIQLITLLVFLPIASVHAEDNVEVEIKLADATMITSASTDESNHDSQIVSFASGGDGQVISRVYATIDLSSLPENIRIENAQLNLMTVDCQGAEVDISIARALSEWDPSEITWKSRTGLITPVSTRALDCINQLANWDITELIQGFVNGYFPNLGIVIYGEDQSGTSDYSKIFDLSHKNSKITIRYKEVADTEPQVTQTNQISTSKVLIVFGLVIILLVLVFLIAFLIKQLLKGRKSTEPKKNLESEKKDVTIDNEKSTKETKLVQKSK